MGGDIDIGKDYVQGLARGLEVIRAFDSTNPRMTLSEVAGETGLTRATARRCLMTLEVLGYVRRHQRDYMLTPKILSLGFSFLSSQHIADRITPILKEVTAETGESCSMGMLEGYEIVYVARSPSVRRVLSIGLTVGSRLPVLTTSMGRALLAFMDEPERDRIIADAPLRRHTEKTVTDREALSRIIAEVRQQGYAIIDEELEVGLRSLAVPVLGRAGRVVAAVNIGAAASRTSVDTLRNAYLPVLRKCAENVALAMI